MTASMLDEVEVPTKRPKILICPCCILTWAAVTAAEKAIFIAHCEAMKLRIEKAIEAAK